MKPTTPKPVVVTTICSECGLAWEAHDDKPTTSDCIRLLKIELAKRPSGITIQPYVYPYVVQPYVYPWYQWQHNTGGQIISGGTYTQAINCSSNTVDYKTPITATSCTAVAA